MSERTVYAIASGKGGVGKTTTAINLGAMLADRGHGVVVVDTDLGMANLADFLDFEIETPTLHEVLAGDADFEDAIYRAPGDIDVLPSGTDIEAFAKSDPTNLQHVVADLREEYDYVLLDTGAGVSYDTLVPLALADGVLLVATPDVASVRDTAKTGELAERVDSVVTGAVLTQRSSDILNADDVRETLGTDVLGVVPQDEAVPMGIDAGRPLAAFAPNAPAGQAYRELAAVVTGEVEPDPELDLDDQGDDESESPDSEEVEVDSFTGSELAENVRNAVDDDQSEGLLGGELATAAEEIRAQANDDSQGEAADEWAAEVEAETQIDESETDASEAPSAGEVDTAAGEVDAAQTETVAPEGTVEDGTDDETTEGSGANGARSVDDLINEHISDDRLGESDSFDEDADDPLAGTSDGRSAEVAGDSDSELSGDDAGGEDSSSANEMANANTSSADEVPFESDEQRSEREAGETSEVDEANEVGDGFSQGEGASDEGLGLEDESDDDRESGGILGRIGSLFN